MELSKIVQRVNNKLAGELLTYEMLRDYLDETIDDINARLNSKFPAFSDFNFNDYPNYPDYNFFPDNFIRSVVVRGAAYKFFIVDEEGSNVAEQFKYDYLDGLFLMERDYAEQVPEEFQSDNTGSVRFDTETWQNNSTPFYFPIL